LVPFFVLDVGKGFTCPAIAMAKADAFPEPFLRKEKRPQEKSITENGGSTSLTLDGRHNYRTGREGLGEMKQEYIL
jgi:hypothetical protein